MKRSYLTAASVLTAVLLAAGPAFSQKAGVEGTSKEPPVAAQEMERPVPAPVRGRDNPARQKMHEAMTKVKEQNKELYDQIREKRKEMAELTKAENFDKAAYLSKHEEIQGLMHKMETARAKTMADVLSQMPAKEREMIAMHERRGKNKAKYGPGDYSRKGAPGESAKAMPSMQMSEDGTAKSGSK